MKTYDYDILATTTQLIEKHLDYGQIEQMKLDEESALIKAYKKAEEELLNYVDRHIRDISTISDLVDYFYYTCHSFNALGSRVDLIRDKLIGTYKNEGDMLEEAINKNISDNQDWPLFGSLPSLPRLSDGFFHGLHLPNAADRRALASMVLIDTFMEGNYEVLNLGTSLSDFAYGSCIAPLLESRWWLRPLIGFYDLGFTYIPQTTNKKFVKLFSSALKSFLNKENSLEAMQMKQYLHDLTIIAWSGFTLFDSLEVYNEIEKLITDSKSSAGITSDAVSNLQCCKGFALKKVYERYAVTYQINHEGLQALVDMLKALGLENLQEVNYFINMVDGLDK